MVSQAGAADAFWRRCKQLKGVNLGFDMTFDEIAAERKALFDMGRIELSNELRGKIVPRDGADAAAFQQARRYNDLADMHARMTNHGG